MTELLAGAPQTPTDGKATAQAPAPDALSAPVEQGKQSVPEPVAPVKQAEGKPGLLTTEPKPTTPEKYEFKLDGDVKLAAPMQKGVETAFREVGLSNEQANKLLNSLVKSHQESQTEALKSMREAWANEVRADQKIGGDHLTETLKYAKQALKEFGSPELTELLDATGLSDNKHFITLLSTIGRKVGGDRVVTGAPPKGSEDDLAARLYPSMAKKG